MTEILFFYFMFGFGGIMLLFIVLFFLYNIWKTAVGGYIRKK